MDNSKSQKKKPSNINTYLKYTGLGFQMFAIMGAGACGQGKLLKLKNVASFARYKSLS